MIFRTALLIGSVVLAYAMLQGWPDMLPGVMRGCLAVLALVAGLGGWVKRGSPEETVARGRRVPRGLDYLAIAAAVLAVECGFLWLLGATPRPLESVAMAIEQKFRPEAAALRSLHDGTGETRAGNWLWDGNTRRPLPRRTQFKPGLKPEIFVRPLDRADAAVLLESRVYVRAFALSHYEQSAWAPRAVEPRVIEAGANGDTKLAPVGRGRAIRHEVFHSADPGGQNVLSALQGVSEARISPLKWIDDGFHLLPPPTEPGGYQYLASSAPRRLEDLPTAEWIRAWPEAAQEYLEIPDSGVLGERLRRLAREAAGEGSTRQQLLQLQEYLRTRFEYSLTTTNPRNLDPIENFLFDEKRGHCEYFASAGALMARALGIPSRVAYGWAGGTWFESAGMFVFRANEAHSWTEVWLENEGWVIMDPTPQAPVGGERARVAAAGETLQDAMTEADDSEDTAEIDDASQLTRVALGLMVAFALPAGCLLLLRRGRYSTVEGDLQSPPGSGSGPLPDYFLTWRRACATRGTPMPPGATLRQHLARLAELPEFAAELLDYHYGTRYEGRASDPRAEKLLTRRIRRWEAEAPTSSGSSGFSGINSASSSSHARP